MFEFRRVSKRTDVRFVVNFWNMSNFRVGVKSKHCQVWNRVKFCAWISWKAKKLQKSWKAAKKLEKSYKTAGKFRKSWKILKNRKKNFGLNGKFWKKLQKLEIVLTKISKFPKKSKKNQSKNWKVLSKNPKNSIQFKALKIWPVASPR